jgi:transposase-like protein
LNIKNGRIGKNGFKVHTGKLCKNNPVGGTMNPEQLFCPNIDCPARGQQGQGNIHIHSQREKRCRCDACGQTFSTSKGTIFYRLRTSPETVMLVITLLAYGCPLPAIVRAFGFDERTVKSWWQRAGVHCQQLHERVVGSQQWDLQQVQADEIKAKVQGGSLWLAMAMMVPTRLWLGGVVSPRRDKQLIRQLVEQIRSLALCRPLLLAVDGLPSYVRAFQQAFRSKVPRWGQLGRPSLVSWSDVAIVRVIKQRTTEGLDIRREVTQGCPRMIERLREMTQGQGGVINTAYIERLNATFRQRLACLARRSRHLVQKQTTLEAGMFLVGCFYNFCETHHSLRLRLWVGEYGFKWVQRTPAIAAGLTDHIWTVDELLTYPLPPPRWQPPKRRGRPSKELVQLIERWCE